MQSPMYLTSSEVVNHQEKNFLRVFLSEKYPYTIKEGSVNQDYFEMYFEEPNASDLLMLKNCSVAINKLFKYTTQTQALTAIKDIPADIMVAMMQRKVDEEMEKRINKELEHEAAAREITAEEDKKTLSSNLAHRSFIASLLEDSNDFSTADSDYFREVDKFVSLISSKCRRLHGTMMLNTPLDLLDRYGGFSFLIKNAIISEYVGFFFFHFLSQVLLNLEA